MGVQPFQDARLDPTVQGLVLIRKDAQRCSGEGCPQVVHQGLETVVGPQLRNPLGSDFRFGCQEPRREEEEAESWAVESDTWTWNAESWT